MTDYDDPDGATEPGEDDDDLTEWQPEGQEDEVLSDLERLFGVDNIDLIPFVGVTDLAETEAVRGIHFDSILSAINYVMQSPGMIPFTTFVQFGEDDYGVAVGGSP